MSKKMDELVKMAADYKKKIADLGKDALREEFAEFFDAFPEIHAVQWEQFAPHFNDGDECIFQVYDPSISTKDEPEEFEEMWGAKDQGAKHWSRLGKLFQVPDEVMKDTFGSDSRVTATRDGFEVEEGFDHD